MRGALPATRFAVETYVRFVVEQPLVVAAASSLTELFAPSIHRERIAGMLANYDLVNDDVMAYFKRRLSQAPRDATFALEFVKANARTREIQEACVAAVEFKCDVLWALPCGVPIAPTPVDMQRGDAELTTAEWQDVMRQAGALGVLQVHLSGGEPAVRQDLEQILESAVAAGLYTNLITSGVTLTRERLTGLAERGLDHVQLSIQDAAPANAARISGYRDGALKKRGVARWVRELSLPLTINAVTHRQNIENRAALIPTREQFLRSVEITNAGKERLKVAVQLVGPLQRCPHVREELMAVAAELLGAVESEIGVLEQLARAGGVRREYGEPDRG